MDIVQDPQSVDFVWVKDFVQVRDTQYMDIVQVKTQSVDFAWVRDFVQVRDTQYMDIVQVKTHSLWTLCG